MDYTLEEIHREDLKIFKEFVNICDKHKLKYYVIGGTFLGAIRHKGFIPWDDDMDIAMPRNDFNKFMEIANMELPSNMELITFKNNTNNRYYLPKIINKEINILEKRNENKGYQINLFIDIFPIDGTPNNVFCRKIYYFKILFYRMLIGWYYIDEIDKCKKRKWHEKILIFLGKVLPTKKIINIKKIFYKIDRLLQKYSFEDSNNVGTIMGAYKTREIVPKEYFGNPTKYVFENVTVNGPEKYDEYLTHMYGNYMTPPKNKEANQHLVYKKESK